MKRREFITLVGGAAAWPLAARAQQPTPVIGFLSIRSADESSQLVDAFRKAIKETGFIDGRDVTIEYRWAGGHYDLVPGLVADLVQRRVALITADGLAAALAAKAATAMIPIVFISATDPVKDGLVASLNRPGGNLTGVSRLNSELVPKRLELLRELVPNADTIGFLVNPNNPNAESQLREVEEAARVIGGVPILVVKAGSEIEFDLAFAILVRRGAGALLIAGDQFFNSQSEKLAALTVRYAIPTIYQLREFAAAGGLVSYGASLPDAYRLIAVYAVQILKGAKPFDLPVQQQTRFELVINLKTAKELGLTISLPLIGRADEVIE
jgi:putative tryptophan/tyrosine transport system substrate-binding protein